MYCEKCGAMMEDGALVCTSCGYDHMEPAVVGEVVEIVERNETMPIEQGYKVSGRTVAMTEDQRKSLAGDILIWGILTLLASLFWGILGLVFSFVFLSKCRVYKKNFGQKTGTAHVGEIIGMIGFICSLISCIFGLFGLVIDIVICIIFAPIILFVLAVIFGIIILMVFVEIGAALFTLGINALIAVIGALVPILTSSVFIGLIIFLIQMIFDAASAVLLFL